MWSFFWNDLEKTLVQFLDIISCNFMWYINYFLPQVIIASKLASILINMSLQNVPQVFIWVLILRIGWPVHLQSFTEALFLLVLSSFMCWMWRSIILHKYEGSLESDSLLFVATILGDPWTSAVFSIPWDTLHGPTMIPLIITAQITIPPPPPCGCFKHWWWSYLFTTQPLLQPSGPSIVACLSLGNRMFEKLTFMFSFTHFKCICICTFVSQGFVTGFTDVLTFFRRWYQKYFWTLLLLQGSWKVLNWSGLGYLVSCFICNKECWETTFEWPLSTLLQTFVGAATNLTVWWYLWIILGISNVYLKSSDVIVSFSEGVKSHLWPIIAWL